jgi:hypothetical protein
LSDIAAISAGGGAPFSFFTCALTTSGAVKCWGSNSWGQLGDGTTTPRSTPVNVVGLSSGVTQIAAGLEHACALLDTGSVRCWGSGFTGIETISGLSNMTYISAGSGFGLIRSCGANAAGEYRCWGNATIVSPALDTGALTVTNGPESSCLVKVSGAVRCGGSTQHHYLGGPSKGDGLHHVLSEDPDVDGDGCTYIQEVLSLQFQGGLRDPKNFWDFFDTPDDSNIRDKAVASADFFRVLNRFGATGSSSIDPLSAPPSPPAYHTAFDRGPTSGPNSWNLTAANGSISSTDFFAVLAQFGHSCL